MSLEQQLDKLLPLRIFGLPEDVKPCCLVLDSVNLSKLPAWLKANPQISVGGIIISDLPDDTPLKSNLVINGITPRLRAGLAALDSCRQLPKIFLFANEWSVRIASIAFPWLASQSIFIVESEDAQFARRQPIPDFFEKNQKPLEKAYNLFQTPADQETFARRLKAIITGDSGYLKLASHLEYDHPLVHPENGDIMLDGGLSNMVSAQQIFADKVGCDGVIHGFEPIPWMAEKAAEKLACHTNYHVHPFGLGEKEEIVVFSSLGDSSHIGATPGVETISCKITTIDEFVKKQNIRKTDMLKLDVEGAELAALTGAAKVIARQYPKLIICLYHKPQDLFEIPLYLHKIAPEYMFYLAHSSAGFTDTILYGTKQKFS